MLKPLPEESLAVLPEFSSNFHQPMSSPLAAPVGDSSSIRRKEMLKINLRHIISPSLKLSNDTFPPHPFALTWILRSSQDESSSHIPVSHLGNFNKVMPKCR
jgi:hypothetical protein